MGMIKESDGEIIDEELYRLEGYRLIDERVVIETYPKKQKRNKDILVNLVQLDRYHGKRSY